MRLRTPAGDRRPAAAVLLLLLCMVARASSPAVAQDWLPGESLRMAIFNLEVTLEIERSAFLAELERLQAETERRERLQQQLQRRLEESRALLDAAAGSSGGGVLDQKEAEIRSLQADAAASSERIRALRDAGRAREDQIHTGEQRLRALRSQLPSPAESLSGLWDVLVLPGNDRAVFSLRQSGTILGGEYLQDGGHHGSLQGTLVDGKVLLSRIDSRQGRSMELEGKVATDGTAIRGSWQSLDVSGGKPDRGLWQARRRPEVKQDAGAPPEEAPPPAAPPTTGPS